MIFNRLYKFLFFAYENKQILSEHPCDQLWYVLTDKMIAASEKLCAKALDCNTTIDPYKTAITSAITEELFFTSFVEGAQINLKEAMDFLERGLEPENVQEQLIQNNLNAWTYMMRALYYPIDDRFVRMLAYRLTEELEGHATDYRQTDTHTIGAMGAEAYDVPAASSLPALMQEYYDFLASTEVHPLIKAAVGHGFLLITRPLLDMLDRNQSEFTFSDWISRNPSPGKDAAFSILRTAINHGYIVFENGIYQFVKELPKGPKCYHMPDKQRELLLKLMEYFPDEKFTIRDASGATGITYSTMGYYLDNLTQRGILTVEKGKRFVNLYSFSSEVHGIFESMGMRDEQTAFKALPDKEKDIHDPLQNAAEAG